MKTVYEVMKIKTYNYRRYDEKRFGTREKTVSAGWMRDFLIASNCKCYWCEKEFDVRDLGLDRIDNAQGHWEHNVLASCRKCNNTRSNMTVREFRAKVQSGEIKLGE